MEQDSSTREVQETAPPAPQRTPRALTAVRIATTNSSMRIALATCANLPEPDFDEQPLLAALRAAGHDARTLAWDDPTGVPADFDVVLLRATWNYHRDPDAFRRWIDRAASESLLLNPAPAVHWNMHKQYLCNLSAAGAPIVPTRFLATDEPADLASILGETGWEDFVIKPAISAASFMTKRFDVNSFDEAQSFLTQLCAQRDAMVQRFMPRAETDGERSIMWIGGDVSHVVRKNIRFHAQDESVSEGLAPSAEEHAFAARTMEALCPPLRDSLLYARIDAMPGDDGDLLLSELELIEPSLYFPQCDGALARFVDAVNYLSK